MSVRFKYAGDKGISAGRSGGASLFTLPIAGGGFPAYGTYIETLVQQTYPISNGGSSLEISGTYYPTQTATVDRLADGAGGSFLDWANAYDVAYISYGVSITNISGSTSVDVNGTNYTNGEFTDTYLHNGSGGYYTESVYNYYPYGTYLTNIGSGSNSISTPVGSFTYETWDDKTYYTDGGSGYYVDTNNYVSAVSGDYIGSDSTPGSSSTEVPSGSGNYFNYETWDYLEYYYDGGFGYYASKYNLWSASYGDFITNDGSYDYYWNGDGTYYT
jgi:hypothetical protein